MAWTEAHGGYWVVSRYEDVKAVALDDQTFSSDNDMTGERNGWPWHRDPACSDATHSAGGRRPRFNEYRKLLNPKFSPAAAEPWRPFLRQAANAMIDRFCESGECDLVHDLASPVPAMLTMRLLGSASRRLGRRRDAVPRISWAVPGSEMYQRAIEGIFRVLGRLSEELAKRRDAPADDLLTFLLNAEIRQ